MYDGMIYELLGAVESDERPDGAQTFL